MPMTTRLVQKRFLTVQEFEIEDDSVKVRIKAPFKEEETLSVYLTVLNPEPVITQSRLEFNSRVNGEPLLSLFLAKPSAREFNAFVSALRERAQAEYQAFAGLRASSDHGAPAGEPAMEPPEPEEEHGFSTAVVRRDVRVKDIDASIRMLETYLDRDQIAPLLAVLKDIREDPANQAHLARLGETFEALGPAQGAVLTYAPYIIVLLSDDPFGHEQS